MFILSIMSTSFCWVSWKPAIVTSPFSLSPPDLPRFCHLLLLPLLELAPEDLARPTLGQLVYELDRAWVLIGGHLALGPSDYVLLRDVALLFFPENNHRLSRLAAALVGNAYDNGLLDGRVFIEDGFDLCRPDVVAGDVDHALEPVDHEEVTLFVHHPDVAGPQETLAIPLEEGLLVGLGPIPVASHHLRTR